MQQTQIRQKRVSRHQDGPIYCVERRWLVAISRSKLEGPFDSQEEAEATLERNGRH